MTNDLYELLDQYIETLHELTKLTSSISNMEKEFPDIRESLRQPEYFNTNGAATLKKVHDLLEQTKGRKLMLEISLDEFRIEILEYLELTKPLPIRHEQNLAKRHVTYEFAMGSDGKIVLTEPISY